MVIQDERRPNAAVVKSEMLARGIQSVSLTVMRDGRMVVERAWGVTDFEKNVLASASTTYFIGFNTKKFTAAPGSSARAGSNC